MKNRTLLLISVVLSLLVSCGNPQASIPIGEQDLPDMIMYDAVYTFGKPDQNPLTLSAGEKSIWQDKKTELKNVIFRQSDELYGECDSAFSKDNSLVNLEGNVKLYKTTDNVKIECDKIQWDDDTQTVKTDGRVFMTYQDGTEITAVGFTALLEENIYEFDYIEEGKYTYED